MYVYVLTVLYIVKLNIYLSLIGNTLAVEMLSPNPTLRLSGDRTAVSLGGKSLTLLPLSS